MDIYEYVKPLGKIQDDGALRKRFIAVYNAKSHRDVAAFCIEYGKHLGELSGFGTTKEMEASFAAIRKWLDGKTNYHEARNLAGVFHDLARDEKDAVRARFYRTMAQVSAVTHVKYHGLWATDFAVTLVNRIAPGDMNAIRKERLFQIALLEGIKAPFSEVREMKMTTMQLLRSPDIKPSSDVIKDGLGDAFAAYVRFVDELARREIHLEWRYYTDGKAWLAKGTHRWEGARGGQHEATVFWLSVWDGFFKVTIYIPEKARAEALKLPLHKEAKRMIEASGQMGNTLKYFPVVFELRKDDEMEAVYTLAEFKKSIK